MRILFISHFYPADLSTCQQGTFKRMNLFIDALKQLGTLDMLFFVPADADTTPSSIQQKEWELAHHWQADLDLHLQLTPSPEPYRSKFKQQLPGIFNFFKQSDFYTTPDKVQAIEFCLEKKPDLIFVHRLNSLAPLMQVKRPLPSIAFDLDDIEHIKFMRQIRQPPTRPQTLLYFLQVPTRLRGELQGIRLADRTFICSDLDRHYLSDRWQLPGIITIPNAIHIPEPLPLTSEPTLLLLGGYYYYPNLNAANFLIEKVWPQVRQVRPDAKLIIAGPHPENIRTHNKDIPGVEFTGFVPDLDALYRRSRIVCCPVLSGGGTRVKMIEAAAYGKPIVSTRIGAEGLEMVSGRDYLQADMPQKFAQACIDLLNDSDRCQTLGTTARAAAIQYYDRDQIIQRIQTEILTISHSTLDKNYAYPT